MSTNVSSARDGRHQHGQNKSKKKKKEKKKRRDPLNEEDGQRCYIRTKKERESKSRLKRLATCKSALKGEEENVSLRRRRTEGGDWGVLLCVCKYILYTSSSSICIYIYKCMYIPFDPLGVSTISVPLRLVGEETGE